MTADNDGNIEMVMFPFEEHSSILAAMKKYELAGDLPGLQWCARRLAFLFEIFYEDEEYIINTEEPCIAPKPFNRLWEMELKHDPMPEVPI